MWVFLELNARTGTWGFTVDRSWPVEDLELLLQHAYRSFGRGGTSLIATRPAPDTPQ
jgi:hypothetical protein